MTGVIYDVDMPMTSRDHIRRLATLVDARDLMEEHILDWYRELHPNFTPPKRTTDTHWRDFRRRAIDAAERVGRDLR